MRSSGLTSMIAVLALACGKELATAWQEKQNAAGSGSAR
jgi:hypothetical protein